MSDVVSAVSEYVEEEGAGLEGEGMGRRLEEIVERQGGGQQDPVDALVSTLVQLAPGDVL